MQSINSGYRNVKIEPFSELSCDYDDARSVLSASTQSKFKATGMFKETANLDRIFTGPRLKQNAEQSVGSLSARFSQIDFDK